MIIAGTVLVSGKKKGHGGAASSLTGLAMIASSLACDGITGGLQDRAKKAAASTGKKAKPYDLMFWTNWCAAFFFFFFFVISLLACVLGMPWWHALRV